MLAACNATPPTTPLSIRELPIVPEHVQKNIVSQDNIQLLYEDDATYYLVYYSKGNVLASMEVEENRLIIHLNEGSEQRKEAQPYVFKISKSPEQNLIEVFINKQNTPIDRMTIL
ncbi:hypothetical protein U1P98_04755 [Lysinibacillus irui]|uniref:Uncharacterized protein n=1 Tax=Lysinibacillus irui TaxID=2998077 RepID=A0ABU5NHS7_9BACI|nr:hypothetical protein [Lysinibacillus irui]MEA0553021.1 hypothetical protein [Lysinibacillus irui]MEA0562723.1 hypothetical protein [Lysinibacillus irui]MEA0975601.1 hypothetical protein [Lysinibacillus irui]MEA1041755.1 hypothetical protein [Lysinibacillus irui]